MNIQRYELFGFVDGADLKPHSEGDYVAYKDYIAELTEARAEISRLESVVADSRSFNLYMRKERDTLRTDYSALREKHDKLSTENAPLRADAARYRWLRDNSLNNPNLRIKYRAANSDWTSISELGELDSVIDCGIDAARAQAEKEWLVENMAVI